MLLVLLTACDPAAVETGRLVLDADALAFGEVPLGEEAVLELGLRNRGRGDLSVEVLGPQLTSAVYAPQRWELELAWGDQAALEVVFAPLELGGASDQLILSTTDPDQPVISLPLDGEGVPARQPQIAFDPASLDFGAVDIGDQAREALAVQNVGDGPLTLSGWDLRGSTAFGLEGGDPTGWVLEPGEARALEVVYTPLGNNPEGSYEGDWGNLVVFSDAVSSPEAVVFLEGNR